MIYRNPKVQEVVDNLAMKMSGKTQAQSESDKTCVSCAGVVDGFRDALSKREYDISGLCQACQDKVFGE